jgi:hypothetical protein
MFVNKDFCTRNTGYATPNRPTSQTVATNYAADE